MPNPTPGPPPSKITHGRPPRRAAALATPQTVEAYAAIIETRAQTVAEFRRTLLDELNKAEAKAAGLVQDLAKAEQRTRFQTLTAPVDGVVQQLAIHTVGGVVTPAQSLLVVVPVERPSGSVTGVVFQQVELAAKRIQLIKDGFPDRPAATRMGIDAVMDEASCCH
jgi:hypothetical protein